MAWRCHPRPRHLIGSSLTQGDVFAHGQEPGAARIQDALIERRSIRTGVIKMIRGIHEAGVSRGGAIQGSMKPQPRLVPLLPLDIVQAQQLPLICRGGLHARTERSARQQDGGEQLSGAQRRLYHGQVGIGWISRHYTGTRFKAEGKTTASNDSSNKWEWPSAVGPKIRNQRED